MTDFGVTPEGFRAKTLRETLTEIEDDQHSEISPNLDTSPQAPDGQRNAISARQHAEAWEVLQASYEGIDPDKAEDDQLIALCKLTGTFPHGASQSTVSLNCDLDIGVVLTPSVHFAAITNKPDKLWTPKAQYTATAGGVQPVDFLAEVAGPEPGFAGTIAVIATPIAGWNSVTNPLDATLGATADTNETLRARREAELAAAGSSTARAIRADLSQIKDTAGVSVVQSVKVLENDGDAIDGDGVPGHSIEAIVYDSPTLPNDTIAQAIWNTLGAGVNAFGSLSGTATDPDDGTTELVPFSRPTDKNIYITLEGLVTNSAYAGAAVFKAALVTALQTLIGVGQTVVELRIWATVAAQPGIVALGAVKLGFSASPTGTADLTISPRERAAFDTSRIVIS